MCPEEDRLVLSGTSHSFATSCRTDAVGPHCGYADANDLLLRGCWKAGHRRRVSRGRAGLPQAPTAIGTRRCLVGDDGMRGNLDVGHAVRPRPPAIQGGGGEGRSEDSLTTAEADGSCPPAHVQHVTNIQDWVWTTASGRASGRDRDDCHPADFLTKEANVANEAEPADTAPPAFATTTPDTFGAVLALITLIGDYSTIWS
jgi:hypothetical protein